MARTERRTVAVAGGQQVSVVVAFPDDLAADAPVVVLAHGAGSDMDNPFLSAVHEGLRAAGFVSVKFNFPYKERGGRAPDKAPVLETCFRAVLASLQQDPVLAGRRLVIGGKSMGGRMATHLAAQGEAIAGLLLLGYPLHPAGKPEQLRDAHLAHIQVPMLFFAGSRDALCRLDLLRATLASLPAAVQLHVIDGADHSFAVPRSAGRSAGAIWSEIIEASGAWVRQL